MKKTLIITLFLLGCCVLANSSYAQLSNTYTIVNKSGAIVKAVYAAPSGTNNWTSNISTVDKIGNNEGFQYGFDPDKDHCDYDFKFVDDSGTEWMMKNISLCNSFVITLHKLK